MRLFTLRYWLSVGSWMCGGIVIIVQYKYGFAKPVTCRFLIGATGWPAIVCLIPTADPCHTFLCFMARVAAGKLTGRAMAEPLNAVVDSVGRVPTVLTLM
jgi:hypothetical protein